MCLGGGDGSVGGGGLEREGAELSSSLDCWVHSSSLRRKVWVGNRGLGYYLGRKRNHHHKHGLLTRYSPQCFPCIFSVILSTTI